MRKRRREKFDRSWTNLGEEKKEKEEKKKSKKKDQTKIERVAILWLGMIIVGCFGDKEKKVLDVFSPLVKT